MAPRNIWLTGCLVLAVLVSLFHIADYRVSVAKYEAAVAECLSDQKAMAIKLRCSKNDPYKQWLTESEDKVAKTTPPHNPIEIPLLAFITLIAIGLIPHAWRFMLNRIRELGDAIRGRQS